MRGERRHRGPSGARPPAPLPPPPAGGGRHPAGSWRLILGTGDGAAADGAANMAVDAALLASVRAGGAPALRLYRWEPPTLSFGRNQPAAGLYDRDAARSRGIAFIRRPTGGQAVLHDDELTYAVAAPVDAVGRPREAYRRINQALVAALGALGVPASLSAGVTAPAGGAAGAARDWMAACFHRPEAGEVVAGGRKLVGSAQRAEGRTILQHGSLLLAGSQAAAEELLVAGPPPVPAGWTTLTAELGVRPEEEALVASLVAAFEAVFGIRLAPGALTVSEAADARRLRDRFAADAWTWRR